MEWPLLAVIVIWIMFWLARSLKMYNDGYFTYRLGKRCARESRPLLFHAEALASLFWAFFGLALLFMFLKSAAGL